MVVTCPKCGTVINRKEWDEVKNKWKIDPKLKRHGLKRGTTRRENALGEVLDEKLRGRPLRVLPRQFRQYFDCFFHALTIFTT